MGSIKIRTTTPGPPLDSQIIRHEMQVPTGSFALLAGLAAESGVEMGQVTAQLVNILAHRASWARERKEAGARTARISSYHLGLVGLLKDTGMIDAAKANDIYAACDREPKNLPAKPGNGGKK